MRLKYVIFENCKPAFCLTGIQHSDFRQMEPKNGPITSAGHVIIEQDKDPITCGMSISLNMEPDPADARIIKRYLEMEAHGAIL